MLGIPGAALVVVQDDKIIYLKGFGIATPRNGCRSRPTRCLPSGRAPRRLPRWA
jgi:hypothetical protein